MMSRFWPYKFSVDHPKPIDHNVWDQYIDGGPLPNLQ